MRFTWWRTTHLVTIGYNPGWWMKPTYPTEITRDITYLGFVG